MKPLSRRNVLALGAVAGTGAAIRFEAPTLFTGAYASVQVPQTPLPGASVHESVSPVPTFVGRRVSGPYLQVNMLEFQQKVLPDAFYATLSDGFKEGHLRLGLRQRPAERRGDAAVAGRLAGGEARLPGHGQVHQQPADQFQPPQAADRRPDDPLGEPAERGDVEPAVHRAAAHVVHLHGGEDQSTSDGVPEAWFTNTGLHGKGYSTFALDRAEPAIYNYPNDQEATTLWFHDHVLGITRINVYVAWPLSTSSATSSTPAWRATPEAPGRQLRGCELMVQDRQVAAGQRGQPSGPTATQPPGGRPPK